MNYTDDIDKFGHCVICHKNLLTKRVVDGKIIDMFLPIYAETMFILDNGSQMQVTICKPCKESNNLNDSELHEQIMSAVQKGWELETKMKLEQGDENWTQTKRDEYLVKMSKLNIDCNSEKLDKSVIQIRQFQLAGIKFKEISEDKDVNN